VSPSLSAECHTQAQIADQDLQDYASSRGLTMVRFLHVTLFLVAAAAQVSATTMAGAPAVVNLPSAQGEFVM
jgi:hypothetical protein